MKKAKRGFTIVELIIVIAVIGVLAAILIPVFSNVIEKSNRKSALSDAKNCLTNFVAEMSSLGATSIPDTVIQVAKGNNIYTFGYTQETATLTESGINPVHFDMSENIAGGVQLL